MHILHSAKRRFVLLALFALSVFCHLSPAFAQSDWYYGKPIKKIVFEGLDNIKQSDLTGVTSNFIGEEFSDEVFSDLLNRIFALNYFDEVNPQAVGDASYSYVIIKLSVVEFPIVSKVRFVGNNKVRVSELKNSISSKEKDIYSEEKRLNDEKALLDLYIGKGFSEIKVSSTAEKKEKGFQITFRISEGQQTVVNSIQFSGNNVMSSRALKSKISLKEVGLITKGSYQESMVEQDKKAIVAYYMEKGYVDAQVLNVTTTPSFNEKKGRRELAIRFNIKEGSVYKFTGLKFVGNKVFSTEELNSLVTLKTGATYNETAFQESVLAVQTKYYENGYTSNQFAVDQKKDPEQHTVSYVMHIQENARSHVEEIIIKGNAKTKEEVIRREIPIESGDIFSYAKVNAAMRNLYNLQYFSHVSPQVNPGSENNLVDLVFTVEEQSTTSLDFGLTFSGVSDPDEFPVALFTKIQDRNLFGEGKSISAGLTLSTDQQSLSFSYGQNWLFDRPISNTVSLSFSHSKEYDARNFYMPDGSLNSKYYYMQYEQNAITLSDTIGRRWSHDFALVSLSGGISGSLLNNKYDDKAYIATDTTVSDYNGNLRPRTSIFTQLSLDGRDIAWDATKGWFFSQRFTWHGLIPKGILPFDDEWGESEFFLRTDTKAEKYFTLIDWPVTETWDFKVILMGYSGLSFQLPAFDSSIKQSNQLYIDGMFYGRGWTIYNSGFGRGRALWNNSVELRMPVIPNLIAFDLFFDASCLKTEPSDMFTDLSNLDDWYFSFGPSIRCCMQQLPLRLLFVSQFKMEDGKFTWRDDDADIVDTFRDSMHFVLSFNMVNR